MMNSFFKTQAEMGKVFRDVPEALDNTNAIIDKVEVLDLKKGYPAAALSAACRIHRSGCLSAPPHHEGAKARYKDITPDIQGTIGFELFTIRTMGFAGYFLIVADFINHGKDIGVFVGPGRALLPALRWLIALASPTSTRYIIISCSSASSIPTEKEHA